MADYMVVASGASSRQVAAMAEHLEFKLKQEKVDILGLEGLRQADWVLLDANDVIVHIFRPERRLNASLKWQKANRSRSMQLLILAVGKGRASPENTLTQGWLSRLPQGGSLIEVESKFPPGQKRCPGGS